MSKATCLTLLVCLNLLLLTALCLANYSLPAAQAAGTGLASRYLAVAGAIQSNYDAVYVLDTRERTLHAFYWDRSRRDLMYVDWRDLDRDFRHHEGD
jgi:hypothetical protein